MCEAILKIKEMPMSCNECEFFSRDKDGYPVCSITKDRQGYFFEHHNKKMNSCPLEWYFNY